MDAIGDVTDRHLDLRPARKQRLKDMPADPAVQPAHAEGQQRATRRQIHHIEGLVSVVGMGTTQRQEFPQLETGLVEKTLDVARIFAERVGREAVEPGFYRGMGGEQIPGPCCPQRLPERETRAPHVGSRPLENGEGGMTLVQVADLDLGGERLDRPPPGDPENDLLRDADFGPGVVELAGDAAVGRAVERVVGVEQVEPDAPDQRLPDAQRDGPPGQVEADAEPGAVRPLCRLDRHRARVVERIGLVLRPGGDRKSTRLNSSHMSISYAVFCLKKKTKNITRYSFTKKTKKKTKNI